MPTFVAWPTAMLVFALLCAPGWLLVPAGERRLWFWTAAGVASLFAVLLGSALLALLIPGGVGVWFTAAVAATAAAGAWHYRRGQGPITLPSFEGWSLIAPTLAMAATLYVYAGGFRVTPEGAEVHAWFNADWFKHLGHVQALANFGMPAKDIFGGQAPLAYYWLFYQVPALGAVVHGDVGGALLAAGAVQTFAFWLLLYGLIREVGCGPRLSAALCVFGWLTFATSAMQALVQTGFDPAIVGREISPGSGFLFRLSFYIPQHQLMLAGLLSWALLCGVEPARQPRAIRILSFAPLVAAGAVSILLALLCLAAYALARFFGDLRDWRRSVVEIGAVGVAALLVTFVLGVVDTSLGAGTLASPAFSGPEVPGGPGLVFARALNALVFDMGPALFIAPLGFLAFARAFGERQRPIFVFAIALCVVGAAGNLLPLTAMPESRAAHEMSMRAAIMMSTGLLAGLAMLIVAVRAERRSLVPAGLLLGLTLLISLPSPFLDARWHRESTERWTTRIPRDDLDAMAFLAAHSGKQAIVLQYPEPPYLAGGGRDTWVPIFAGRAIPDSMRSTEYRTALPGIANARAFFDGKDVRVGPDINWVYLSRTLHPQSFDGLRTRLRSEAEWRERLCLPGACLFERTQPAPDRFAAR